MTRTYVRTRDSKPYPSPQTEREELQNILWGMGTAIPGSSITDPNSPIYVEMSELRDLVQWQAEKIAKERWRDRRDMGTLSFRIPGVPGQDG
jgi:hypothetical protein